MAKEMTREQVLLRAAWQLLNLQDRNRYVINLLEHSTTWDGVPCDGHCLMEEIGDLLTDAGIVPTNVEERSEEDKEIEGTSDYERIL